MKVCAIIAEYNPFHLGHLYHIKETKRKARPDYLVVIMSGSFTQRGEPAGWDKWQRAAWALKGGADLVLELPAYYALQSAEGFARGALHIVRGLNVCTHLSFGSECTDLARLQEQAAMQSRPAFQKRLQKALDSGMPYAKAISLAGSGRDKKQPNAVLATQYLRFLGDTIHPVLIPRQGDYHSTDTTSPLMSATAIRAALGQQQDVSRGVPDFVSLTTPLTFSAFDLPIRSQLYALGVSGIARLQDVTEGLENRIWDGLKNTGSLSSLLEQVKTRRYTGSHLRRILLYSLLGITKDNTAKLRHAHFPVYARVLGLQKAASPLLAAMKASSAIPLIQKPAEAQLSPLTQWLFQKDILATNLVSTVTRQKGGQDYTHPIITL